MNRISNAENKTDFKLKESSKVLLLCFHRNEKPKNVFFTSYANWWCCLYFFRLREPFSIGTHKVKQRIMTILLQVWGQDQITKLCRDPEHHTYSSIKPGATAEISSKPEDQRGNKSFDSQIELAVCNFSRSDKISREISYKKQAIHPPPLWTSVLLRFLHLATGKTLEQIKIKCPTIEMSRSKFFSLRSQWVREWTPQESCLITHQKNANLPLMQQLYHTSNTSDILL